VTGPTGSQGATGPYNTPSYSNAVIPFRNLSTSSSYIETSYAATNVLLTKKIIVQGYQCSTSGDAVGMLAVWPLSNGSVISNCWTIGMTVAGTSGSGITSYTVYYYGLT
jgi:hypothetical protein